MELEKETKEEIDDESASLPFTFPQSRAVFSRLRLGSRREQIPRKPVIQKNCVGISALNNSEEAEAISEVSEENGSPDNVHGKDINLKCASSIADCRNTWRDKNLENELSALSQTPFLSNKPVTLVKRVGSGVKNKYTPNSLTPSEGDGSANSGRVLQDILNHDRYSHSRRILENGAKPELYKNSQKLSVKKNEPNVAVILNKDCKYISSPFVQGGCVASSANDAQEIYDARYFRQNQRGTGGEQNEIHRIYNPPNKDEQRNGKKTCTPRLKGNRDWAVLTVKNIHYNILSKIGSGGSSQVFQVLDQCGKTLLAVKCVELSDTEQAIAEGYLKEIELLQKLQNSNRVIKLIDYEHIKSKMLYIVMEKGDTDLSTVLKKTTSTNDKSMPMIIYYWTEMLLAVKEIHDHGVVHSDLKPANFLLVNGRLKLIDFGIASSIQKDVTSIMRNNMQGTCNYMSPESIQDPNDHKRVKVGYRSDVWSLGCILYYLLYGKTPFQHITNNIARLQVICNPNHTINFTPVDGCPPVLMKALKGCLRYDAKERPTVQELLRYPYIRA